MAGLQDLMRMIGEDPSSVEFQQTQLQPGWSMARGGNVGDYAATIPSIPAREEIGGFDRFMLGSESEYLTPDQRSDARTYSILSAIGSIPQRGILGAIPAGMEAGRSSVDYQRGQDMSRDWQGYASGEARRAASRGDQPGYERYMSAFYGKPGVLPKAQYPPHTVQQETIGMSPTGEPINQAKMVVYDPRVGGYVAKTIPGLGPRTLSSRQMNLISPTDQIRLRQNDAKIQLARQNRIRWEAAGLYNPENYDPFKGRIDNDNKANEMLSNESADSWRAWVKAHPTQLEGATGSSEPGPNPEDWPGGMPPSSFRGPTPETGQDRVEGALEKLKKRYLE